MLGLKKRYQSNRNKKFSEKEKRHIIEDYLQSGESKRTIWQKYTGQETEHGLLLKWMRKYGYDSEYQSKNVNFAPKSIFMNSAAHKGDKITDFEYLQLQRRVLDLEHQLQESEMKSIAYQTMIDIAEREFNISIKKKFNTKPSKK
jgi:transposase-like protein